MTLPLSVEDKTWLHQEEFWYQSYRGTFFVYPVWAGPGNTGQKRTSTKRQGNHVAEERYRRRGEDMRGCREEIELMVKLRGGEVQVSVYES